MKLSADQLKELSERAESAAKRAGEFIKEFPRSELEVVMKEGGESLAAQVVTQVDIEAEGIILKELESTFNDFDLGLLTEEKPDDGSRFEKDYFWCIDPLDGTLPFVDGTDGCSVSIALVSRLGRSVIGVVYDFVNDVLYSAAKGWGAFRNSKKWELTMSDSYTLVYDRSFLNEERYHVVKSELKAEHGNVQEIGHGGATVNAMWVLEHAPAQYAKAPKASNGGGSVWDYAAVTCIFEEIGSTVSDFHGKPLNLNRKSTFMNEVGIRYLS